MYTYINVAISDKIKPRELDVRLVDQFLIPLPLEIHSIWENVSLAFNCITQTEI